MAKNTPTQYCSFCGRPKKEVKVLIQGLDAWICDECINQAMGILKDEIYAHMTDEESPSQDFSTIKKPSIISFIPL